MRYLLLSLFTIFTTAAFAQSFTSNVTDLPIGISTKTNTPVSATQFEFPYSVYKYEIDTARNELFIAVRKVKGEAKKNSGYLALIDLNTNKVKWSKKMIYFNIVSTKDLYQIITPEKIYCHRKENDSTLWERPADVKYVIPERYIAYKKKRLIRVNEKDGTEKWAKKRKMDISYGIEDMQYLDDSTLLIAESGLHTININTGDGWDTRFKTGTTRAHPAAIAAAIMGGFILGSIVDGMVGPIVKAGMNSGIVLDNDKIYYASSKDLTCINTNGFTQWDVNYEEKTLGTSSIFNTPDNIILLSQGFVTKGDERVRHGDPFIAAYNKTSGHTVYTTDITTKNFVYSYALEKDTLLIGLDDSLVKYNINTGTIISAVSNKVNDTSVFKDIVGPGSYFTSGPDNTFHSLEDIYPHSYVLENDDNVAIATHDLRRIDIMDRTAFWKVSDRDGKYLLVQNKSGDKVVLYQLKKIAVVEAGEDAFLKNGHLYYSKDNKFVVADLKVVSE